MIKVSGRANRLLLIGLLTFSAVCHAISFGELKVYSYLGEPFVAEIELTNFKGIDPGMMQVSLSSAADFSRAGVDRPYYLNYLAFDVFTYKDRVFIAVRSSKFIQTPYMEFLLTLSWPTGNLIKEYTILLDPPPPNLTKETRPKSFAALYDEAIAQQNKSFGSGGVDEVQAQIQMQQSAEQRAAAEESLTDVVRESDNSFSDYTFDSILPHEQERVAKLKASTALVPGEVPEVLSDEEQANREAYADQLKEFNLKKQQQIAAQQQKKTETKLQKVVGNLAGLKDNIDDAANIEQVLADDRQNYPATSPATTASTTPAIKPIQPTTTSATLTQATTPVQPATPPPATSEPIDFNVPPPAKPMPTIPATPTAVIPHEAATASTSALNTPTLSPTISKSAADKSGGNHLYLGWILSLLLLAVGIAFAVKRRLNNKSNPTDEVGGSENVSPVNEAPLNEKSTEDLFNEPLEDFELDDADTEHIELISDDKVTAEIAQDLTQETSSLATDVASADELAQFEREIESIDLDKIDISGPTLVNEEKAVDIIGPSMENNNQEPQISPPATKIQSPALAIDTSELTLSKEGADLVDEQLDLHAATTTFTSNISPEYSEELAMKIDLAKQYLETGDKSSAKMVLEEVVAAAKDEQLLEARMLLSGII